MMKNLSFVMFGVVLGVIATLAIDMVLLGGKFAAHAVLDRNPHCMDACHKLGL